MCFAGLLLHGGAHVCHMLIVAVKMTLTSYRLPTFFGMCNKEIRRTLFLFLLLSASVFGNNDERFYGSSDSGYDNARIIIIAGVLRPKTTI